MNITEEEMKKLDAVRRLPWTAIFWKTLDNPTVPGGKVDMYLLIDDETGIGIVGLSVPHGDGWLAEYVAAACRAPYFARCAGLPNAGDMAVAWNRTLPQFFAPDGTIDARDVHAAAMTMIEGYVEALPKHTRQELIDNTMARLNALRNAD